MAFRFFITSFVWAGLYMVACPNGFTRPMNASKKRVAFRARRIEADKLDKYAADFVTVYNKAWAMHEGNKEMTVDGAQKLFRSMKPILDPDLVWFTYYKDEPIAFFINIPDVNKIFKNFHGKFGLWQKLQFLWYKKRKKLDSYTGIIFGRGATVSVYGC